MLTIRKDFEIVWWYQPSGTPKVPPKINYFERLELGLWFFCYQEIFIRHILHKLGVPTPKYPSPKISFWKPNLPIDFCQLGSYAELALWLKAPGFEISWLNWAGLKWLVGHRFYPNHERFKIHILIFFMRQNHFVCIAYDWVLQKYR